MPKVPNRPLSHGELRNKLRRTTIICGTRNFPEIDVRPTRRNSRNGPLKIIKTAQEPLHGQ